MITKEALGKRVRDVRQKQKMTLKDVENLCGLSSTHISEIERGMTSPTIGALIRIAHALAKDPSYFIEERELEEVCVMTEADRPEDGSQAFRRATAGTAHALTRGILGGRICAYQVDLAAGSAMDLDWIHYGEDVCFLAVEGKAQLTVGKQTMVLAAGDSVHGAPNQAPRIENLADGATQVLVIMDPRDEQP